MSPLQAAPAWCRRGPECSSAALRPLRTLVRFGGYRPQSWKVSVALTKAGVILTSGTSGRQYEVMGGRKAKGGFGEVFQVRSLSERGRPLRALKLTRRADVWHREAYFGTLFAHHVLVVRQRDTFMIDGKRPVFAIVNDWMDEGTVADWLHTSPDEVFKPDMVRQQVSFLLELLVPMHKVGITHRDITPANVFLVNEWVPILGDFGVMHQEIEDSPQEPSGHAPLVFLPADAHDYVVVDPSLDVYMVALIAAALLTGEYRTFQHLADWRELRDLECDDDLKAWLLTATAPPLERYRNALEALDALYEAPPPYARAPKSLQGRRIVFTGTLDGLRRTEATRLARAAGAVVHDDVQDTTDVIVVGEYNPRSTGQTRGLKLFAAERRLRRGQRIALLHQKQFERLAGR